MAAYLLRKLRDTVFTLLLVSIIVFIIFALIPGNPARIIAGVNAAPEKVAFIEAELGLDQPLPVRFINYLAGLVTGNPGMSLRFHVPVTELIGDAAPITLGLAFYAFFIIIILAIPLGLIAARRPGGVVDTVIHIFTETTLAIPPFFMAIILMLIFRVTQADVGGSLGESVMTWGAKIKMLSLPALAIALSRLAMAVEFLRDALVEQSHTDYVRTARGKGASQMRIRLYHVLRNCLVPTITALGLILAEVVGGSIIIEQVFLLPGLGRLLFTAVEARDFPLVQTIIMLIALLVVAVNFVVDFLNQFIDPRLRTVPRSGRRRHKYCPARQMAGNSTVHSTRHEREKKTQTLQGQTGDPQNVDLSEQLAAKDTSVEQKTPADEGEGGDAL
ncbi:MAG TPA: ABC transporter permease [Clostridiaceae bacterium]|nr:ABC transporter permease [Clostridiaceae bacterium]